MLIAPIIACAAAIQFVKAMLSFEETDIATAIAALRRARHLVTRGSNLDSTMAGWGKWLAGYKTTVTSEHIHCRVMAAGK